jgi:formyl-CoA transferase
LVSEEEVKYLMREGAQKGVFDDTEQEFIHSVFAFADTTAREVLTPRTEVHALAGPFELMRGRELNWASLPTNDIFETTDGAFVIIGGFSRQPMKDLAAATGLAEIEHDARFATHELRVEHRATLHGILRARFATDTTAHWIARLEAQDLLCAPVRKLGEALEDPQVRINGMVLEADAPWDRLRLAGSPVHLADAPVAIRRLPPRLGEHTDAVLAELGLLPTAVE